MGLVSFAILYPAFIFCSTSVGASMTTITRAWQRVSFKDASSDDNLTKLHSTRCQHCLPVHYAVADYRNDDDDDDDDDYYYFVFVFSTHTS